jgi:hypothetical protein
MVAPFSAGMTAPESTQLDRVPGVLRDLGLVCSLDGKAT